MDIGTKIKQARKSRGLTQRELGALVGVNDSAVAKWEKNKVQNLKRSTIMKLADALGMEPSDFILNDSTEKTAEQSRIENAVMAAFLSLTVEHQADVVNYIKKLVIQEHDELLRRMETLGGGSDG